MKSYAKTPLLLALSALLLVLPACAQRERYRNDLPCTALMEEAERLIPSDLGYTELGSEQILYYFEGTNTYDDVCLRYSTRSENINEIGIFHSASEEEARRLREVIAGYLTNLWEEQEAFIASYAPEELPKLKQAEIRSFGCYTVSAILSKADKESVFRAIEERLSVKE